MYDHNIQRPRDFGFITFDSEDIVDNVLQKSIYEFKEKMVEVKHAISKEFYDGSGCNIADFSGGGHDDSYGSDYGQDYSSSPGRYDERGENSYGLNLGKRDGYAGY
ncbi:hypothetical protein MPTK1_8g18240 [Marchantia polymorpha subsp. ruderalis]|nr:hypothetical protein Mp_8g18240 [Marchantia polymorpha subsp. ruderalis]